MAKYNRVVITCGTSLLGGRNVYGAVVAKLTCLKRDGFSVRPVEMSEDEASAAWQSEPTIRALNLHLAQPEDEVAKKVSAEYSMVYALNKSGLLHEQPHIVLIHTHTFDGSLAANTLKRVLESRFKATVSLSSVDSLDVNNRVTLQRGLGSFMESVASALNKGEPSSTCFAPIGGYKIMTAMGTIAGGAMGYPTAYIHETGQILHMIPAIPIRLSVDEIKALVPLFWKVNSGCNLNELTEAQAQQLKQYAWLFEQVDELVALNAFGYFFAQHPDYKEHFAFPVLVSTEVERLAFSGQYKAFALPQLQKLLALLLNEPNTRALQHEWVKMPTGWHLYKGVSNGALIFRALYRFEDGQLHVAHVWFKHPQKNTYEDPQPAVVARQITQDKLSWLDLSASFLGFFSRSA